MTTSTNPLAGSPLRCEPLEHRDNPSGNVAVSIIDGVMILRGDPADNQFSIQMNSVGDLFIFGRGDTTINGQPALYVGRGAPIGIQVIADAGNDQIEMINVAIPGTIWIQAGDEFDGIALYGVTAGNLVARAEGGDDVIVTDGVRVAGYAELNGGSGFDTVDLRNFGITAGALNFAEVEWVVANPTPWPVHI